MNRKIGRNELCPCESGRKYKRCCLQKKGLSMPVQNSSNMKFVKISSFGTERKPIARLGIGVADILEFSNIAKADAEFIWSKVFEAGQLICEAEDVAKPIVYEIHNILNSINKSGVPVDESGKPYIPGKCNRLADSKKFIEMGKKAINLFFEALNKIWGTNFSRENIEEVKQYVFEKWGADHLIYKLLVADSTWLVDLNKLIALLELDFEKQVADFKVEFSDTGVFPVTMPLFSNGLQIGSYLDILTSNLLTFIEELIVLSIGELLDPRLVLHDLPETLRDQEVPVRFKIGVRQGVDIAEFRDHPKLSKIYRSGQQAYHLRNKFREGRFGRVRPIIAANYQGQKIVAVANRVYSGKWETFSDFLYDYLKIKFGETWWKGEFQKPEDQRALPPKWAKQLFDFQREHGNREGDLFSMIPNGPSFAYYSLAYDLFVLEDNQYLQGRLIERLRSKDVPNFWGARYEAYAAATMIKAGFDIEYINDSTAKKRVPEFIATHRGTGEKIAVEAKKRNRQIVPKSDEEIKLNIASLIEDAVGKYDGTPFILFLELDLPPIVGDPLKKPWFQEFLNSHDWAGIRGEDGKDVFNMIVFTNYPVEHPESSYQYPARTYIISQSEVPRHPLKNEIHLMQIVSVVEKSAAIPTWFEE